MTEREEQELLLEVERLASEGRFEDALKRALAAEAQLRDEPNLQLHLASIYLHLGCREQSAEYCGRVLSKHPNRAEAHLILAQVEIAQSHPGVAKKHLSECILLGFNAYHPYLLLARIFRAEQRPDLATGPLMQAVSKQVTGVDHIHRELAQVLASTGRLKTALAHAEAAARVKSDSWENWLNLGNLYVGVKATVRARDAYRKALDLNSEQEESLSNLANVNALLCDWSERDFHLQRLRDISTRRVRSGVPLLSGPFVSFWVWRIVLRQTWNLLAPRPARSQIR